MEKLSGKITVSLQKGPFLSLTRFPIVIFISNLRTGTL
jgi:hypothetical protein